MKISLTTRRLRSLCGCAAGLLVVFQAAATVNAQDGITVGSSDGRRHLTAAPATRPVSIDGILDDEVWQRAQPAEDFVQAEPHEGEPATEGTEVRIAFDRDALYVGVLCRDSDPTKLIINDIRKDFFPDEQDSFAVLIDTFADRRNGVVFYTNPRGAKADTQIANEGRDVNTNWDAVWTVAAKASGEGWSAEMRIPFKTLRFEPGQDRTWGINFARRIRRKNEIDYWAAVPRAYNVYRASLAGTLDGLPDVNQGRNLRLKPFVLGGTVRGLGQDAFDREGKVGLDVKYGLTPALTLDGTVNPDFAQAEADEQQVNLTQFSLFFPEKREFFLENSGVFYFGDIPRNSRNVTRFQPPSEDILLFFSRKIGLSKDGRQLPIRAGARVTGSAGGFGVGALTIQTAPSDGEPGSNYSVVRVRRNILSNSDIGAVLLSRQSAQQTSDYNRVAGIDANFRFFRFFAVNSFLARSYTPGVSTGQWAGKASVGWEDNFLHTQYSYLSIGDQFRDDIGFLRRIDIQKHFVDFGIRPRPASLRAIGIREIHPHVRINYLVNQRGEKVTRDDHIAQTFHFENGGSVELAVQPRYERISKPFNIQPGVTIPVGGYNWTEYLLSIETNHSRVISGSARVTVGGFWSGHQVNPRLSAVVRPSYHFRLELGMQLNKVTLKVPTAAFTTNLVTARAGYAFNTKMFLDTLVQYNTNLHQVSANVRFNLIHRPLSDIFVVYNEQQWTDRDAFAGRSLVLKYTHMLAF